MPYFLCQNVDAAAITKKEDHLDSVAQNLSSLQKYKKARTMIKHGARNLLINLFCPLFSLIQVQYLYNVA